MIEKQRQQMPSDRWLIYGRGQRERLVMQILRQLKLIAWKGPWPPIAFYHPKPRYTDISHQDSSTLRGSEIKVSAFWVELIHRLCKFLMGFPMFSTVFNLSTGALQLTVGLKRLRTFTRIQRSIPSVNLTRQSIKYRQRI